MNESTPQAEPVLAVLLSGGGRTLANLLRRSEDGGLHARVGVVISSVADAGGLDIARAVGIPALAILRKDFDSDEEYSDAIYAAIAPHQPDLIVLAGFLRRIVVPPQWEGRILNIHPALLPELAFASGRGFYGERVHRAVLASGATESGATVHFVDNGYDTGAVYRKVRVPVLPGDTVESLAARVFDAECELYPKAIEDYLAERGRRPVEPVAPDP